MYEVLVCEGLFESMIVIFDEGISYLHCLEFLNCFSFQPCYPSLSFSSLFFSQAIISSPFIFFFIFFFFIQLFPFNRSYSRQRMRKREKERRETEMKTEKDKSDDQILDIKVRETASQKLYHVAFNFQQLLLLKPVLGARLHICDRLVGTCEGNPKLKFRREKTENER